MPGTLFIVATPLGNLSDITFRAVTTLQEADLILCEDTRMSRRLLAHYDITNPLESFHEHTAPAKAERLVERLASGESMALITDAGTPGLSDPGNVLVSLARAAGIRTVPVPGPSALATLLSVAGLDMREFLFLGFPPHKKGRQTFFEKIAASPIPVAYYESPHRVEKNLELLRTLAPGKRLVVGRELTKIHESILTGTPEEVLAHFSDHPDECRGEFTIICA
jgi:16S rRNA (cytidine1402-2'-O)-methyltransferase